jgi:hypothetical protein
MDGTSRLRQRVLTSFLPVSAALLVVGEVSTPKGVDQIATTQAAALKMVRVASRHTTQLYASNVLIVLGLAAFGVSFAAMATLVNGRGATLATVAAVLGGFGAFCGALANVLVGFNLATAVSAYSNPDTAATFLVTSFTSGVGNLFLICYLLGLAVALILVVIAVWRSRCMPRWLAILLAVGWEVAAFAPAGFVALSLMIPFALAMALVTTYIWRATTAMSAGGEIAEVASGR